MWNLHTLKILNTDVSGKNKAIHADSNQPPGQLMNTETNTQKI